MSSLAGQRMVELTYDMCNTLRAVGFSVRIGQEIRGNVEDE